MSGLFGNHIVGFPTRQLIFTNQIFLLSETFWVTSVKNVFFYSFDKHPVHILVSKIKTLAIISNKKSHSMGMAPTSSVPLLIVDSKRQIFS